MEKEKNTLPPAPQDLRERVEEFVWTWALANNLNTYGNQKAISEITSKICGFAAEVSAEKQKEVVEAWNIVMESKQRIAELENELKRMGDKIIDGDFSELKSIYKGSFPDLKNAWELLCEARTKLGWKDFYFMVLRMQKESSNGSKYKLNKTI